MNHELNAAGMFAICMLLAVGVLAASVTAQSPADLRRENERLAAENQDLALQLEQAQRRIANLEREIMRLARELEAARRGQQPEHQPDVPRGPGSVDESEPAASPRALLRALTVSYEEAMKDMQVGEPRSRERTAYMRALTQWRNDVQREFRSLIEWHVGVVDAVQVPAGYRMRLQAVDPKNKEPLGDSFEQVISRTQARRYEQLATRGEVGLFVLRGSLTPAVNLNEDRTVPGPFNNPPFIGPFAEFGFTIDVRSFLPMEDKGN